ncbi:MAG TPA: fumarate hydratase [Bacteroidota bacterium]|nr:fumarate hydratase [Bacteroidota bacterium]
MDTFKLSIAELITDTSTNLPPDVRRAIKKAQAAETPNTRAALALETIATNIDMANTNIGPICQDTGMPTFFVHAPVGANQIEMKKMIREAIADATKAGTLRPNSVDSLTGKNSGNNLGEGSPVIHFEQWDKQDEIEVKLILKGGGCENKNIQYSLPAEIEHLGKAGRTLDGVRKCILHAIWQAQGHGCAIGAIGVAIGGDRTTSFEHAKAQLFRTLDDTNPVPELAQLEETIMKSANTLNIGTMGFGGNATLIGCKIGALNRLPASFFVSVAYNCWAFRRQGVVLDARTGAIKRWLYRDDAPPIPMGSKAGITLTGKEISLTAPFTEEQVRALKVGDVVLLNGPMFTGRDAIHAHFMHHDAQVDLHGQALYHCGPVMIQEDGKWKVKAAGPTTSGREEPYEAEIIRKFGIRAVIGKGGMGAKTLAALKEHGCVYLNAIGGAAQYYAECITDVSGVDFIEFGVPEAMWHLHVKNFPAIVTMDSHGGSLHAEVENDSAAKLARFAEAAV